MSFNLNLFLSKRPSPHVECAKTEQGDHQISKFNDVSVEKSLNDTKLTSNSFRFFSSSNAPDINSTAEGEGESTIVASIASRTEECMSS